MTYFSIIGCPPLIFPILYFLLTSIQNIKLLFRKSAILRHPLHKKKTARAYGMLMQFRGKLNFYKFLFPSIKSLLKRRLRSVKKISTSCEGCIRGPRLQGHFHRALGNHSDSISAATGGHGVYWTTGFCIVAVAVPSKLHAVEN